MDTSEAGQITSSTENVTEVAPEVSETVTLTEGENETVSAANEVVMENGDEEVVKSDVPIVTEEQSENVGKESNQDGCVPEETITPTQADASLLSTEVVDVTPVNTDEVCTESNKEISEDITEKKIDDIEVLEVATAHGADVSSQSSKLVPNGNQTPPANLSEEVRESFSYF